MSLFTKNEVTLQPVSFRNTTAVRRLAGVQALVSVEGSPRPTAQIATGEMFTSGYALNCGHAAERMVIFNLADRRYVRYDASTSRLPINTSALVTLG